jgi:two-component system LytT family response regulator
MPITTLIIDDEPLARQTLRLLLASDPEIEIVGECADGPQAIEAIRATQPDLVFLDIRMPGCSGFDVIAASGLRGSAVVFVTAYDQYAVDAFRAEALDYLLKPFDDARFEQVLRRAKERLLEKEWSIMGPRLATMIDSSSGPSETAYLNRLLVRARGRLTILPVEEIDWIQAADNYVELHSGSKSYLVRHTMRDLRDRLDPAIFFRTHRSAIVNLRRVRALQSRSHGEAIAVLAGGSEAPVSRQRRLALERALERTITV